MLLTAKQVSEKLQVKQSRVYELCRLGLLPHVRLGRQIRVSSDRLEEWIKDGGVALPGVWRRESRL
ncbi:Helix-turn-helix domain protein [compost metagenome]